MNSIQRRASRLRWLFCLVFPAGYILTVSHLEGFTFEYLALTVIATLLCALSIITLQGPLRRTIPAWTMLAAFLGAYYVEFYELLLGPWILAAVSVQPVSYEPSRHLYFSCFVTITLAFAAFCAVVCWYYGTGLIGPSRKPDLARWSPSVRDSAAPAVESVQAVTLAAVLLVILTSVVVYRYHMIMGLKAEVPLPFHFEGVIVYIRLITIPMLLLFIVYAGLSSGRRLWRNGGVALLIIYSLSDMVLRASKGTLPLELFCLAMLWILSGQRVRYRHIGYAFGLALVVLILFPLMQVFRGLRTQELGVSTAMVRSFDQVLTGGSFLDMLGAAVVAVSMRVTGTGVLLNLIGRQVRFLGMHWFDVLRTGYGMQGYVTLEVFGAAPELVSSFGIAPSLLGYFYIIGANAGVVLGMVFFTALVLTVWNRSADMSLRCLPAAQALVLQLIVGMLTEGTLDIHIMKVGPIFTISVLLVECLSRIDMIPKRRLEWRPGTVPIRAAGASTAARR